MRKPFAAFDIDGTLIRWQLFHAVLNTLAKQGHLGESAYDDIRKARFRWKQRLHDNAYKDYETALLKIYYETIRDLPINKFEEAVKITVDEYKNQVYVYPRKLLKSLKSKGYFLLAISGSHQGAVAEVAIQNGFDDWVGSTLEIKNGKFTGKTELASTDKHLVLKKLVEKHRLSYKGSVAVGDTASDISMMEAVENPVAFNPNSELLTHAKRNDWKIVVERKNVIYELEAQDGQYILAETKK